MGTINCTVNEDKTITVNSIEEGNPRNTWAKFQAPLFEISGGGTFNIEFTAPAADFQFDPLNPIDWGAAGQPSWIQILTQTATALTLAAESSEFNVGSTFTIRNVTAGGESIVVAVQSTEGSGGEGEPIKVYLGDDRTALIGPLLTGALGVGSQVRFGFRDEGDQEIVFSPGTNVTIESLIWNPSMPDFIEQSEENGRFSLLVDNDSPLRQFGNFTIVTNFGNIDPTIITNPDESAP